MSEVKQGVLPPLPAEPTQPLENPGDEARRIFGICNICGYCNGFCAVFDAARERPALTSLDLDYLANLCHACRNCLEACQYQPPHAFSLNVPRTLERLRWHGYTERALPRRLAAAMRAPRQLAVWGLLCLLTVALLLGVGLTAPMHLNQPASTPGAFYTIVPFKLMVGLGILSLAGSLTSIAFSLTGFWRDISADQPGSRLSWTTLRGTLGDIVSLRQLNGGGPGCIDSHTRFASARRWLHQLLLSGLVCCLIATLLAAFWHHGLGQQAPYARTSAPVLFGLFGGILVTMGAGGLLWVKSRTNPLALAPEVTAADQALTALLLATVLSGLTLLIWRGTPAMGLLLITHLGCVYGLFLLLPVTKIVHAGYRALALLRHRMDKALADARDRQ